MKLSLLFMCFFQAILTGATATPGSIVLPDSQLIPSIHQNQVSDDHDDDEDEHERKGNKHYKHRGNCKNDDHHDRYKTYKHGKWCRHHDNDDDEDGDHCNKRNNKRCDRPRNDGAVVISFPTVVIPFPRKH